MKNIKFLIFSYVLFNCSSSNEEYLKTFPSSEKISPTETLVFDSLLSTPMQIAYQNGAVLINEFRKYPHEKLLSIWDAGSGKLIKRVLNVGNGPNERVPPLKIVLKDNMLSIYEKQTARYTLYEISNKWELTELLDIARVKEHPTAIYNLDDYLLGVAPENGSRFATYKLNGDTINTLGNYPEIEGLNGFSNQMKDFVFQGRSDLKPDKTKFVISSVYTDNLEIYELNNKGLTKIFHSINQKPVELSDYSDTHVKYAQVSPDHPLGYSAIFTNDKYIYALYSGKSKNEGSEFINLLKIDWLGNPIKLYILDQPVECLTIDQDTGVLYAISEDYNRLLKYQL